MLEKDIAKFEAAFCIQQGDNYREVALRTPSLSFSNFKLSPRDGLQQKDQLFLSSFFMCTAMNFSKIAFRYDKEGDLDSTLPKLDQKEVQMKFLKQLPRPIHLCNNLQILRITDSYIAGPLRVLTDFENLRLLDLRNNLIVDKNEVYELWPLHRLTSLDLRGNPIEKYRPLGQMSLCQWRDSLYDRLSSLQDLNGCLRLRFTIAEYNAFLHLSLASGERSKSNQMGYDAEARKLHLDHLTMFYDQANEEADQIEEAMQQFHQNETHLFHNLERDQFTADWPTPMLGKRQLPPEFNFSGQETPGKQMSISRATPSPAKPQTPEKEEEPAEKERSNDEEPADRLMSIFTPPASPTFPMPAVPEVFKKALEHSKPESSNLTSSTQNPDASQSQGSDRAGNCDGQDSSGLYSPRYPRSESDPEREELDPDEYEYHQVSDEDGWDDQFEDEFEDEFEEDQITSGRLEYPDRRDSTIGMWNHPGPSNSDRFQTNSLSFEDSVPRSFDSFNPVPYLLEKMEGLDLTEEFEEAKMIYKEDDSINFLRRILNFPTDIEIHVYNSKFTELLAHAKEKRLKIASSF